MRLTFPIRYHRQVGWTYPGLKDRWAIYSEIHNLRSADPNEACYWTQPVLGSGLAHMKYGWGTFNGACDPLDLGQARTYVGAWVHVLRSVWRITRD